LYAAAILAFPAPLRRKVSGLVLGVVALGVLNLIRIASLILTGVYAPNAFNWLHLEAWQPLFIAVGVTFWVLWLQRTKSGRPTRAT
jgi:exosortase/archaeosortase family protein